jgi:hypothetical protein
MCDQYGTLDGVKQQVHCAIQCRFASHAEDQPHGFRQFNGGTPAVGFLRVDLMRLVFACDGNDAAGIPSCDKKQQAFLTAAWSTLEDKQRTRRFRELDLESGYSHDRPRILEDELRLLPRNLFRERYFRADTKAQNFIGILKEVGLDAFLESTYPARLMSDSWGRSRMNGEGKSQDFSRIKVLHGKHVLASMFLRTAKCTAAGTDAEADALRVETGRKGKRPRPRANGGSTASHPIAPGKDSCPSPPWDATFPGAFFMRRENCWSSGFPLMALYRRSGTSLSLRPVDLV